MTTSQPRILCLGHAAHDLVYRVATIPGEPIKVVASDFYECGGGMAANAAVTVARLGGRAVYWGRVADDALGARILGELAAEGVDVSAARRVPNCRSPLTSILVTDAGERLICSYTDANIDADPAWLPLDALLSFAVVMADVRWPQGAARVLDTARSLGIPALVDADVAKPEILGDLAGRATHVLFSAPGLSALEPGHAPGSALRRVRRDSHVMVGVTLGEDGFLWLQDGAEHRVAAPAVTALDTLAAGDVWHGAFALALAEKQPTYEAVGFANAAAAIKCSRRGGRLGCPSRVEVDAALQR